MSHDFINGSHPSLDSSTTRCPVVKEFECQVDTNASRDAIHLLGQAIVYEKLESWANSIANELIKRRGDVAEPVPLLIHNPAYMLAAELAVLKAGKFYVPVNPRFPALRVRQILEDLQSTIVVCDDLGDRAVTAIVSRSIVERIRLEEYLSKPKRCDRPSICIENGRYAYVLYTSGSSGHPKGIVQTRRDMFHNVLRHAQLEISPEDRLVLLSPDGFVGSVSNPFIALLNGASLAPYSFQHDGVHGILDWLERSRVSLWYSFPSFLRQVALTAEPRGTLCIRIAYLGGETVLSSDVASVRCLFPGATFSTGLNSTETGLTRLHMIAPSEEVPNPVPIGGPVPDVEIVIVDSAGRDVIVGERGEILVRSPYVRPGYWRGDGVENATREVSNSPGTYEFRTKDRGYFNEKHQLIHLGRSDSMIKVRGYRVETSEVEAAISGIAGVAEVVVVPYSRSPEELELAAYILTRNETLREVDIRYQLADVLPKEMVPSTIVIVDSFPRTANGKVDRRALPTIPNNDVQPMPTQLMLPANEIEVQVAGIWRTELRTNHVSVTDDFFALGGTSITAVKIISRIRKELETPVSLHVLFETPTVRALSDAIIRLRYGSS